MTSIKHVCRLCLELVFNNFVTLDSCKERMLKIVSSDLDVVPISNPLICSKCEETLQHLFTFKESCLSNEDYLKTFLHHNSDVKLNLEEILQKGVTEKKIKCENERVCRLCLAYFDSSSFVKLDNTDDDIFLRDMIRKCLPEIKLEITNHPLICFGCMETLQTQFNFIITCLDNDENIKNYVEVNGVDTNIQVNLSDVLKFIESTRSDKGTNIDTNLIKRETVDINVICDITNGEEFVIGKFDDRIEENQLWNANSDRDSFKCQYCSWTTAKWKDFKKHNKKEHALEVSTSFRHPCAHCDYRSNYKFELVAHLKNVHDIMRYTCRCGYRTSEMHHYRVHLLKHKRFGKVQMYSCEFCNFRTTYKSAYKAHVDWYKTGDHPRIYQKDVMI